MTGKYEAGSLALMGGTIPAHSSSQGMSKHNLSSSETGGEKSPLHQLRASPVHSPRRNSNQIREHLPMAWVRDTLARLDVR